mmetsp:Transcript_5959/g.21237  ORF Transcript_5959/g.21237 Transcript_5959/m.21237 type:complete len:443 (+) Transcript_5959:323-1651(+)
MNCTTACVSCCSRPPASTSSSPSSSPWAELVPRTRLRIPALSSTRRSRSARVARSASRAAVDDASSRFVRAVVFAASRACAFDAAQVGQLSTVAVATSEPAARGVDDARLIAAAADGDDTTTDAAATARNAPADRGSGTSSAASGSATRAGVDATDARLRPDGDSAASARITCLCWSVMAGAAPSLPAPPAAPLSAAWRAITSSRSALAVAPDWPNQPGACRSRSMKASASHAGAADVEPSLAVCGATTKPRRFAIRTNTCAWSAGRNDSTDNWFSAGMRSRMTDGKLTGDRSSLSPVANAESSSQPAMMQMLGRDASAASDCGCMTRPRLSTSIRDASSRSASTSPARAALGAPLPAAPLPCELYVANSACAERMYSISPSCFASTASALRSPAGCASTSSTSWSAVTSAIRGATTPCAASALPTARATLVLPVPGPPRTT